VAGLIEYVMKEGLLFEKQPFFHNIKNARINNSDDPGIAFQR